MGAPEPIELAEQMLGVVARLRRLVDQRLEQHSLSLPRARLLGALVVDGPSRQSVLAARFELAPRTITELIDGLERHQLVERRPDPHDRRAYSLYVTPAGRAAHAHAMAARTDVVDKVFAELSEQERGHLSSLVIRIGDTVSWVAGGDTISCITGKDVAP